MRTSSGSRFSTCFGQAARPGAPEILRVRMKKTETGSVHNPYRSSPLLDWGLPMEVEPFCPYVNHLVCVWLTPGAPNASSSIEIQMNHTPHQSRPVRAALSLTDRQPTENQLGELRQSSATRLRGGEFC
jgi:hypothetical protein